MTTRMNLAYVAMAALTLMISGGSAARAATQFCDIYPERCQYSGNGEYYYYPQGYRVGSAGTASGGGTWGCAATNGRTTGRSWGYPSRVAAAYSALSGCTTGQYRRDCRIIRCSALRPRSTRRTYAMLHQ